jgi:glycosyltransferase involved in cell wall biosynthesis
MKKTFQKSTGLSSISPPFLDWSLKQIKRKQNKNDHVIPLTVPKNYSSLADRKKSETWWDDRNVKLDQQFRACFVGSVSSGFNFQPIFIAAKETHIQIVIAGEGSRLEALKNDSKMLDNISYPGWVDISKSEILFERSSIMIAPIIASDDFEMSIPNKFYDAMKYGIPIISSIKGYGRDVIEKNNLGYCYDDATELVSIIRKLQNNRNLIDEISMAQKDYFNKHFEYGKIYGGLVRSLTDMFDA